MDSILRWVLWADKQCIKRRFLLFRVYSVDEDLNLLIPSLFLFFLPSSHSCPQNSSGRGLREGKCVLQPLRAGGGAQPRGYLIALKSKTKSCLQSFKSIWPNNPTYGDLPKEDGSILKGYLHYRAYCTNIYNSQDTSASLNGRMDREDMRTYLCIISWRHFAKWDNHTEKDEYGIIITYMCNLKKAKAYRSC